MLKSRSGFTIVELLIVIVVIGILAAITIVAYNGIQQRGRDAQRKSDVANIAKALELYYIDNGQYPLSSGSTTINSGWSTTADASWQNLRAQLVPKYIANLPSDPINTPTGFVGSTPTSYSYAYYSYGYCGAANLQMSLLVYRLEASSQVDNLQGNCNTNSLYYGGASNYRVVKGT